MRILLLAHAFNSLTQRLFVDLREWGHDVSVEFDINDRVTEEAVALFRPQLVIAPFLKRAIPESVWRAHRCIVIHPGIPGDRGPSALDWAIMREEPRWGVTALQANGEMDAGDIWASVSFAMRPTTKASLYRNEVTDAAIEAIAQILRRLDDPGFRPRPLDYACGDIEGSWRPPMRQADRAIDWEQDDTETILRKVHAADGAPGVLDTIAGERYYLYGAHLEKRLRGTNPGAILAQRDGAVCRATRDAAIWITHLKCADDASAFKLPATKVLDGRLASVPEDVLAPHRTVAHVTWREIEYVERGPVGFLHFRFYNGAMSTNQCMRLRRAYRYARSRPTRVIALMGGEEFWSNGIDLNAIEASAQPAEESWRNINAMNDLVRDIVRTPRQLTLAALAGNAGAGGVFLALAADRVLARDGIVMNPHYKSMGNLYGSEYWTYLLPRRVGASAVRMLVDNRLPLGARRAAAIGLADQCVYPDGVPFAMAVEDVALALAQYERFGALLDAKNARRAQDEARKPLSAYREEELGRMRVNFFGFDSSYHVARYNFVRKSARSRTPLHLAVHRKVAPESARALMLG
ncbi:MAG TPA: hydrogenase maturation protein [Pseudomonadota bacterium]|nr:hydrogenase maturation protein [Pseudomonadota bacterium]